MGEIELSYSGAVATLWLSNPGRRNALDDTMVVALTENLKRLNADPNCRIIVLRGRNGDFCSGRDVSQLDVRSATLASEIEARLMLVETLLNELHGSPKITVAAVERYAMGFGCSLLLLCDLAIGSRDMVFATPEVRIGVAPTLAAVTLLRNLPAKVAMDLLTTGRRVGAEEAHALGLVSQLAGETMDTALDNFLSLILQQGDSAQASCKRFIRSTQGDGLMDDVRAAIRFSIADIRRTSAN